MTASIAIRTGVPGGAHAVDVNLAILHLLIRAEQEDRLCRWFRGGRYGSFAEAWAVCVEPKWMLALLAHTGRDDEAALRKAALGFVRNTPTGNGGTTFDLLDQACRDAIGVGDRYAAGRTSAARLRQARRLVHFADTRMRRRVPKRLFAQRLALRAAYWALGDRGQLDVAAVSSLAVNAAYWTKTPCADAKRFQANLLRSLFGNPFAD